MGGTGFGGLAAGNGAPVVHERAFQGLGSCFREPFPIDRACHILLPGAGKAVILSHGAYRTVYSNLASVSVAKGQKADTKQAIGTVLSGDDGPVAHIEVWKITADGLVNVDPALWIYR